MPTPGVDFFRVDRSAPTRRILFVAGALVTIGASAIGAHLVHRLPTDVAHLVSLVGGLMTLSGLVLGFGSMATMLFENVYIAIQTEGLLVHDNGRETKIAWDDLEGVDLEPKGMVALRRAKAASVRFHAGGASKALVARVEEARRKATIGLLARGGFSSETS